MNEIEAEKALEKAWESVSDEAVEFVIAAKLFGRSQPAKYCSDWNAFMEAVWNFGNSGFDDATGLYKPGFQLIIYPHDDCHWLEISKVKTSAFGERERSLGREYWCEAGRLPRYGCELMLEAMLITPEQVASGFEKNSS